MSVLEALLLAARMLLAAVFGVAGVAKLFDLKGSRKALADFGLPVRSTPLLGTALPLAELSVTIALLPTSTARFGTAGALALLGAFIAGISVNLVRGRTPNCHCFGQLHSKPVGMSVLVRNVTLAVVALFVLIGGWNRPVPSTIAWMDTFSAFERAVILGGVMALLLLVVQTAALLTLVRRGSWSRHTSADRVVDSDGPVAQDAQAVASIPNASLPIGSPAPPFLLPDIAGQTRALNDLLERGRALVLVFADPKCGPCSAVLPRIVDWEAEHAGKLSFALISRGAVDANRALAEQHGLTAVLLQTDREVASAYRILGTPGAVLVHPDGTIGSAPARGEAEIENVVREAAHSFATPPLARSASLPDAPFNINEPAPDFALPDLKGRTVTLSEFRATPTVLLFWNPACGFCRRMLDDLKLWDARPPSERWPVLVVSTGSVEANAALDLKSTIVLDSDFSVGRRYGVRGTPAAALVDSHGVLTGAPSVGTVDVLFLLEDAMSAALPLDKIPIKSENVDDELLADGGMILYHTIRRNVVTLNGTGALVWEYCDGDHTIREIVREIADVFGAEASVENDVRRMLDRLLRDAMILWSTSEPHPVALLNVSSHAAP